MPKIAFSDLTVRALGPGTYFDTKTPAFGLRVGKNRRTWIVLKGSKSNKVRLGHYPALSLAEARKKALVTIGSPYKPSLAPSFPDARTTFLEQHARNLRLRSRDEITRTLNKHFTWSKAIDKITANDIATVVAEINKPSEANHAFKDIRTFFNWCVPRYLKHSPCMGLKMPHKSTSRARVLSDEELARIWRACDRHNQLGNEPTTGNRNPPAPIPKRGEHKLPANFCTVVKLLILTGMRRTESASLKSDYIDLDNKTICLPSSLTKNKREHLFPIGKLATEIFEPLISASGYLFPARGNPNVPFSGWSKSKAVLDALSGTDNWTLHDLRRTYATNLAKLGVPIHIVERLLNHVSGSFAGIVSVYQRHQYLDEMRAAIDVWESCLTSILSSP